MAASATWRDDGRQFLAELECQEELLDDNDQGWSGSQLGMCRLDNDNVSEVPLRSEKDAAILNDERVLRNLLNVEDKLTFSGSTLYFNFQEDIKPYMRKMVTMWMLDVCTEQERDEGVFLLAVTLLDKFLSSNKIKRTRLQLAATVCLMVASKIKEACPFSVEKLVAYTDYSISCEDLVEWEMLIVQSLNWDIVMTTAHDFMDVLLHRLMLRKDQMMLVLRHAQTFACLSATEHTFLMYPPSVLATASICASISGLIGQLSTNEAQEIDRKLQSITNIDIDCIKACQEQIEQLYAYSISSQSQAFSDSNNSKSSNQSKPYHNDLPTMSSSTPTDVRDIQF